MVHRHLATLVVTVCDVGAWCGAGSWGRVQGDQAVRQHRGTGAADGWAEQESDAASKTPAQRITGQEWDATDQRAW
eukprot:m.154050 g.154050  ORF g.154050 m.154050 type:complete len:76 (-) comp17489_c0_seq2:468-695(-)